MLTLFLLSAPYSAVLVAQTVEDKLEDPEGDLVAVFPPNSSSPGRMDTYLNRSDLDVVGLTLVDHGDYRELLVETASPLDAQLISSGKLVITVPLDTNGDGAGDDLLVVVGGLGEALAPAQLVRVEDGVRVAVASLNVTVEGKVLRIVIPKSLVPAEHQGAWSIARPSESEALVLLTYAENTASGVVYIMDLLGPVTSPKPLPPEDGYSIQTETTTAVVATQPPQAAQSHPVVLELMGGEPTDPTLMVSISVERLDVYMFSEDGIPYVAFWVEATLSLPEAFDASVHMVVEYNNGTRDEGTVIPSIHEMAKIMNQDPDQGIVFREWDPVADRGGLIALLPQAPGDYGQARLLFGYIGPRENPRDISDVSRVYLVAFAFRDQQKTLWNAAVAEASLRVINAEPPDTIKDMIEEGIGLPRTPVVTATQYVTTTIVAGEEARETPETEGEAEEAVITTATPPASPGYGYAEETTSSEATAPAPATLTQRAIGGEYEYEEEEAEEREGEEAQAGYSGYGEQEGEAEAEAEAEQEGGEGGEAETGEGGEEGGEAGEGGEEGEEGEGANLPTREIAIAIVLAAVGGVALSFIRKK